VGGDDDGVNGLVGRSGVATAALNGDAESGGRGEERSWCDVDRPNRDIGADVEAKGGGNVGGFEDAVGDAGLGSAAAFSAGENKTDRPGQRFAASGEDLSDAQGEAIWASWPQACMTPSFFEANGREFFSGTGSASISARQRRQARACGPRPGRWRRSWQWTAHRRGRGHANVRGRAAGCEARARTLGILVEVAAQRDDALVDRPDLGAGGEALHGRKLSRKDKP